MLLRRSFSEVNFIPSSAKVSQEVTMFPSSVSITHNLHAPNGLNWDYSISWVYKYCF